MFPNTFCYLSLSLSLSRTVNNNVMSTERRSLQAQSGWAKVDIETFVAEAGRE